MVNSAYLSAQQYNRQIEGSQSRDFQRLSSEVSSSGASGDYTTVENVRELLSQEVILEGVQNYRSDTLVNRQKMATIASVMGDLRTITSDLEVRVKGFTSNPNMKASELENYATAQLQWMTSLLNKQYVGEYLFSGTASTTAPVTDLRTLPLLALGDPVDTTYYLGAGSNKMFRANDNTTITTNIRADDEGISQLITALRYCINLPASELPQRLAMANELCIQAQSSLIDSGAALDSQIIILDTTESNLGDIEQWLEENIQAIGVRSQAEVIQDFYQKKTTLAMSQYITTASLNAIRDLIDRMP
jgi:flagellar hook-associated protein 3 FlgL